MQFTAYHRVQSECALHGEDSGGGLASVPRSFTSRGTAQASLIAVLLASLPDASALSASAEAAVTASKGMASSSFTKRGMPYCSLQEHRNIEKMSTLLQCRNGSDCVLHAGKAAATIIVRQEPMQLDAGFGICMAPGKQHTSRALTLIVMADKVAGLRMSALSYSLTANTKSAGCYANSLALRLSTNALLTAS